MIVITTTTTTTTWVFNATELYGNLPIYYFKKSNKIIITW